MYQKESGKNLIKLYIKSSEIAPSVTMREMSLKKALYFGLFLSDEISRSSSNGFSIFEIRNILLDKLA